MNSQIWHSKTDRLNNSDGHYFSKWDNLIDLEFLEELKALSSIWSKRPEELQKEGRCLCNLRILSTEGSLIIFGRNNIDGFMILIFFVHFQTWLLLIAHLK